MTNTFQKLPLSASIDGKRVLLTSITSASANPVHTALAGTSSVDEVWLYAYNDSTASILTSILWGGTVEPDDVIRTTIPVRAGNLLLIDGHILQNGKTVSIYATTGSYVSIGGFVNRITVIQ